MNKTILSTILMAGLSLMACTDAKSPQSASLSTTSTTTSLPDGWQYDTPKAGNLPETYGVTPTYGMQDNYFDIVVGEGINVALKIIDANTHQCIRYLYVPEGQTVTANEIPPGAYYLKLAYGHGWISTITDSATVGKFSQGASYEKSVDTYDFGAKYSQGLTNYTLKIKVEENLSNNFQTQAIGEEEFLRND